MPKPENALKNPKTLWGGTNSTPNQWRILYQIGEIWLQKLNKWLADSGPSPQSTHVEAFASPMTPDARDFDESVICPAKIAKKIKSRHFWRDPSFPHFWKQPFFFFREAHFINCGTTKRKKNWLNWIITTWIVFPTPRIFCCRDYWAVMISTL
jgi:hypothetical protein